MEDVESHPAPVVAHEELANEPARPNDPRASSVPCRRVEPTPLRVPEAAQLGYGRSRGRSRCCRYPVNVPLNAAAA